jgi:hypothetical protein
VKLNVQNVAVVTAQFAIFPPNCMAAMREETAELAFLSGGKIAHCHRNDTNAADYSAVTAAMQFVSVAAIFALILSISG